MKLRGEINMLLLGDRERLEYLVDTICLKHFHYLLCGVLGFWGRQPKTETWREPKMERDAYKTTSRFGYGAQRTDSLGVIITDSATY